MIIGISNDKKKTAKYDLTMNESKRAKYSKQIVVTLSRQLIKQYSNKNINFQKRMNQIYQ